jgi:lariat debranching enzyme
MSLLSYFVRCSSAQGHGMLDDIYSSVEHAARLKNWPSVDLVIICGDFQAVRNADDLNTMSCPPKYRVIGDFHKYYSGEKLAPYLTVFIGGNHEAASHMRELYYGGWAAPNIYYMGAANVLRLGSIRIAGLSGIWKGFDYRKPHYERLPFTDNAIRSFYHVRELDVRKLLQIRTQIDVGLSHDWPQGMEWLGDHRELFRQKSFFQEDAKSGRLGSPAALYLIDWLRPAYWFSAHMHVKYPAVKTFESKVHDDSEAATANESAGPVTVKNDEEIDLGLDDDLSPDPTGNPPEEKPSVPEDVRSLLPESFSAPKAPKALPHPKDIANTSTKFLALDKLLPNRDFLQLTEVEPLIVPEPDSLVRPLKLSYDPEWLAITRVFRDASPSSQFPQDEGSANYAPQIEKEAVWVEKHIQEQGRLRVPENFALTAPVFDPTGSISLAGMPREYSNTQTREFCDLVGIQNFFHDEEEVLIQRHANLPPPSQNFSGNRGGGRGHFNRGPYRGRGRGFGRGRGLG